MEKQNSDHPDDKKDQLNNLILEMVLFVYLMSSISFALWVLFR